MAAPRARSLALEHTGATGSDQREDPGAQSGRGSPEGIDRGEEKAMSTMHPVTTLHPVTPVPAGAASVGPAEELEALKRRQRIAWSAGDYAVIGTTLQIVGETLAEAVDLRAGERVLDVAAGNGNAALAAARRYCRVTALDYVPALLERAEARAAADGLELEVLEADAEEIPLPEASFDAVLSTFGVMFTANQERAARELVRVCRPGGRIGLASWTPEGFIGQLFAVLGRFVPPPAAARSPSAWGTERRLEELFAGVAHQTRTARRHYTFRYASPAHWLDVFRTYYGPMQKTFAAVPPARQGALETEILGLLLRLDRGGGKGLVIDGEYLEAVITVR
jgi:ubiquinone/menaquinone biosynthesis C-methylase UbiE